MWILWPAFLLAGIAEGITFSLFDPNDMHLFGASVHLDRMAVYSIVFFVFWAFAAASSALTYLLQRSPFEMNRCPLPESAWPRGCPRRGQSGGRD
jgi:hypothetical protein